MKKIRVHVYISGRVQGVGYRYSAILQAEKLGITGWVRNTHDNKVEAVFEGEENVIEEMLVWCKKGPSLAFVTDIEIQKRAYTGEFTSFTVRG
ncbi:MAG: acylphosphatase [bacterium]